MKYINYLMVILSCAAISPTLNAQVVHATDYVLEGHGDAKFTKAIQAAVFKASAQANGQVFIGAYKGQYTLPITPIKFYDFNIRNICANLSNNFNINCNHLQPGSDGLVNLKNLTITIDCGITLQALKCDFKGLDEMLGFNGFKNFNIIGYGATFTMEGFEWYKKLDDINEANAAQYQTELAACGNRLPNFCTSASKPWQNTRNCRKESTHCLECWTGKHHSSTGLLENFAQGRHGIHLANCNNVQIEGIAFDRIYSDGINLDPGLDRNYQWKQTLPCRNIRIKDCLFKQCGRVGVCCCSVNGALITNCAFENNGYVIAGVDIDLEPFNDQHSTLNITIQNCSFKGAANTAISVGPGGMTRKDAHDQVIQTPVQRVGLTVKDCVISETEFGLHHAGGPYLPHPNDKVRISNVTLKRLGHEYDACNNLPANNIQACKDSLDNFARIGLLFDSRLTPQLVGNWSFWEIENLVMKELSTETNGHQFTWHALPVFIRTTHFQEYALNNRFGCAEDLTECPNYTPGGLMFDELFGGLSLKNIAIYDNHGDTSPNVRAAKPIARQEFCIVKSQRYDNTYFLPRFANVQSENVIKINPQNMPGYKNVFNANTFDCDLIENTYSDDFQLHASVAQPAISVFSNHSAIYEGSTASFTLRLSQAVSYPLSIDYQLKGAATNRLDYSYLTGNIIVAPNNYEATLTVEIIKDCVNEQNGSENLEIALQLDGDKTYTIQQKTAQTKILDFVCTSTLVKTNCGSALVEEEPTEEPTQAPTNPIDNEETTGEDDVVDTPIEDVKGDDNYPINTTEEPTNNTPTCKDDVIFANHTWVGQLVNRNNCTNEKVSTYSNGIYTFVYIDDGQYQQLYYQDGTYFCRESVGFECLQYYKTNYNLIETNCWACNETTDNCTIIGCADVNACNYNPAACLHDGKCDYGNLVCTNPCNCAENNESIDLEIFDRFPALADLIDENNCESTTVQTFEYPNYAFIAITNLHGTSLYLDYTGINFYCSNASQTYCTGLYNLTTPTATWQCWGNNNKPELYSALNEIKPNLLKAQIYPNPNRGNFYVSFNQAATMPQSLKVYTASGQLLKQIEVVNHILPVNISNNEPGLYLIEAQYDNYSTTQKVLVHP